MPLIPKSRDERGFDYGATDANGQYENYPILSDEERARGFVRPVRTSYRHVGIRPQYPTREITPEEHAQHGCYGYVLYEEYPADHPELVGRFWTAEMLRSGCGAITSMSRPLAETWAADPTYYGATYCVGCRKHIAVEEFIWDGTDARLGS